MARAATGSGVRVLPEALRLLGARRELWPWALAPLALNLLAFGSAAWLFVANLDGIAEPLRAWFEIGDPHAWYAWLWVAPLRALAWATRWILLLLFAAVVYLAFTLVGSVIAAPFLDALSLRVERIETGVEPPEPEGSVWGAALRSVREEARRVAFFAGGQIGLFALGLVPGLQPFALAGSVAFAALFLPLDYTGYALDRRSLPFRARRAWLWQHRGSMLPFGGAALLTFWVPGLNFLSLPWLVTAGTLLCCRLTPPGSGSASADG